MLITSKLHNKLFQDSFWSVFGNGLGSGLLLLSGIIIARFLGSDLYGEYGVVKSTMFYIASFATFGLGVTSTRYIAQYTAENTSYIKSLIKDCSKITLFSSGVLAIILIVFADILAKWLDNPSLATPFRFLGVIIVSRAVNMTQIGILGGLKYYKKAAINAIISGVFMLLTCIPLTYYFSLPGALSALLLSQIVNCILNRFSIHRVTESYQQQTSKNFIKELLIFSFPVALQESTYFIGQWGGLLILTKLSSLHEVGLFSASAQWDAIILYIPNILYNVIISHLSSQLNNRKSQLHIMKLMLLINCISTIIPFLIILILSDWIASFYGPSYEGMSSVLNVLVFNTIFTCCSNVFRSQFIAYGKNWLLLLIRSLKDFVFLTCAYILITIHDGTNGALYYAWADLITSIVLFTILFICTLTFMKKESAN